MVTGIEILRRPPTHHPGGGEALLRETLAKAWVPRESDRREQKPLACTGCGNT